MRASILASTMCIAFFAFSVLADEQQKGVPLIHLACTPDRCEKWHYDSGTRISMTTDCISHAASTELSFPSRNGPYILEDKSIKARRVIDVTDTAVKQVLTWGLGEVKHVTTILVNRIDGKYNETSEQYSKWGTEREKISGTCLSASELTKRKF